MSTDIALVPKSTTTVTTRTRAGWGQIIFENGAKVTAWIRGEIRGEAFQTDRKTIPSFMIRKFALAKPIIAPFIGDALARIGATKKDAPEGVDVEIRVDTGLDSRTERLHMSVEDDGIKIAENLLQACFGIHRKFGK
jgi:hypothetical protein